MKKTVEQILRECQAEMQKSADVIGKLIEDSQKAGVVWPETEAENTIRVGDEVVVLDTACIYQPYKAGNILKVVGINEEFTFCEGFGFSSQAFLSNQIQKIIS